MFVDKSTIGILICAYDRDVTYISGLSKSLKASGYYVVVGYDANYLVPEAATVNSCDFFFSGGGHKSRGPGHLRNMSNGHKILVSVGCVYSLCITGDAVISKPEKIVDLVTILDGADVMTCQWNRIVSTMLFFGKTYILSQVTQAMLAWDTAIHNETKFQRALAEADVDWTVRPCRKRDKGVWATIGYSRRSDNYPPG